jgi:hypothetical protein
MFPPMVWFMCPKLPIAMAAEADPEIMAQAVNAMRIVKPTTHDESEWYGSYNTLLTNMFPWIGHGNGYVVVPQFEVYSGTHNSIDFCIQGQFFAFVVERFHHPILFIEVKPCTAIKYIGSRARADLLMRQRMDHLYENCLLPKLYGISAIGTLYAVYTIDTATGECIPHGIPRVTHSTDTAPKTWWCNDLLTQEGQEKLCTIFQEVKQMTVEKERQLLADEEMNESD